MAETVTGTTVGDVKYVVAYYDVNTNNLYDANGNLFGNNTLTSYLDNEFTLELHYVQDISTSSNPEEWVVWDGLKDLTVSSTLAFDDNYLHAVKGTVVADTSAGSPSVSVDVTDEINKDTLSRYGVLLVNPFGDEEDQLMIPYSSFQQISGTTFSFIVDDAQGLEASVTKDSPVRISDPLYMFINANDIYEANIPNRYEEGVFKFPVNVMSRKLLNALDYSGSTGVSGTMEHKIYANKNTITGITVTGSATVLKRDIDDDEVAGLHIAGVKTTIGEDTVYPRDASHDTTNDGTAYYAWMNTENNTVAFYTKTTNVTVGTLLYDEMYFTQLEETVSALVDVVNPYLFCAWTNGATVSPTVFWTKGNEVDDGDSVYTISGGTATVVSGTTASPNVTTEPILFRTFAFPFIVRNLVDYGVSLTIPVEDIDWTKEYVISIIRNNMEEVNGKASEGAYGVVMIDGSTDSSGVHTSNIHVSDGVISVPNASATVRGAIQIATSEEVTAGESTVLAVTPATLKVELDKKQDNLTFTLPLNNSGNTVSLQYGDGLAVGVTGTTNANKLITDNATVEEILTDSRKVGETTKSNITDRVVEPHDFKGALSVGQAVDVSCPPLYYQGFTMSTDGGNTWNTITNSLMTSNYLNDFSVKYENAPANGNVFNFGFYSNALFPKYASGLKYLFIFDIKNSGATLRYNDSYLYGAYSNVTAVKGFNIFLGQISSDTYTRKAVIFRGNEVRLRLSMNASNTNCVLDFKNFRVYEVTSLTDEAIEYLAHYGEPVYDTTTTPPTLISHGSPDDLFRNPDIHSDTATTNPHPSVLSRYLIKQDMVAPWIPTINMPDNSVGLTVGAGLSYKIKYTKTGTYSVSVDTIPTDAYGWDAHIQMFVKDTAIVQFQAPLILMDALTPNSGHNLSVKFRNGNALVYVDDTNAGTMVYLATGTTTTEGSLPYALSQTPPSEDATFTNFVVFSPVLGGTVCSMGTMSNIAYSASLIGNGDDSTIVGGTIGLSTGKYLAVQDLNLNDVEITSGTLNIGNNVKVTGTTTNGVVGSGTGAIKLDETCLLDFSEQESGVPISGSVSATSGAKVIPYGETESVAIDVTTGTGVNKYGKIGYIVSVDSGMATGSLYDALVGGGTPYSNVIFDPALDGSTVAVSGGSIGVSREVYILGNGQNKTILAGCYTGNNLRIRELMFVDCGSNSPALSSRNGIFTNCTFSSNNTRYNGGGIAYCGSQSTTNFSHCIFVNNTQTVKGGGISKQWSGTITVEYCEFRNNTTVKGGGISLAGTSGSTVYITGSTFNGNTASENGGAIWTDAITNVTDCIFVTASDSIYIEGITASVVFAGTNIINSTVSGAGTVVFADGATVTSTIPEGSTIGTGTINLSGSTNYLTNDLGTITIDGLTITNGLYFGIYIQNENVANLTNCNITGNTVGDAFVHINSTANISGGTYCIVELDLGAILNLSGRVNVRKNITGRGVVNLADNTIIDCTGNTNTSVILMGAGSIGDEGAVIVGSGCKVVTSGGSTVSITGGTYYSINNAQNAPTTAQAPYVYGYATVKDSGVYVPVELQNGVVTQVDALVLSRMSCHDARIALMDDCATRHIKYYVKPNDLTKKLDGTASKLDGTDGDVMTEFPKSHFLYIENGTVATSGGNDTKDVVLMSRSAFTYNNVDSDWHKSFYISPDGNTVRNQFMGYYPSYVDEDNKMRSISGVYPRVNLRLGSTYYSGTTKVTNTNNPSYLKYAGNNGGTNCNRLHYEWLYHLLITKELTIDTQSISLGFCYMSGTAWSTAYPRLTGYSNQVDFYGGQTFANDNDKDIEAMWSGCSITSNSLVWGTSPDKLQFTTSGNTRTVTAFGWRNGTSPNFSYVYTKFEDGMPQIGDTCYSDASCTVEYGTITAVNTGTASSNRVTSCKYFIENPWSNLWQNQAGYVPIVTTGGVRTTAGFYRTTAINSYETILTFDKNTTDATAQNANVEYVEHPWATANNYVITWNPVTFHALTTGAINLSKMKDYFYVVNTVDVPRCGFVGGSANTATYAGLGFEGVSSAVGNSYANCVGRLSA